MPKGMTKIEKFSSTFLFKVFYNNICFYLYRSFNDFIEQLFISLVNFIDVAEDKVNLII